ncbi:helix-turn-helix domain-containing protein [Cohnella caldifontis]|uniref:helix-turn-helix domain-containing protein n=1 Tax=Cohnella caldifontis TaxID=3027471 RepID=UPI0023EAC474|nr:helix-turn-helix domain-containing protein [Cohnella sp. YIM B05605]
MDTVKQRRMKDRVDSHLRRTARRMVQFQTFDETLHYMIDSFFQQFQCDYVSIATLENRKLSIRVTRGESSCLDASFPLDMGDCLPQLFDEPLCSFDVIRGKDGCALLTRIQEERFQTWFTIPIRREDGNRLGLCVIGFRSFVPLVLDGSKMFEEFGKDIATAFDVALQKEAEHQKVQGLEWLRENAYLFGYPIERIVEKIVERAGKGTGAYAAVVYLYDEPSQRLLIQPPVYGPCQPQSVIRLNGESGLQAHFPYLERSGGPEISIPLVYLSKMIGLLHVIHADNAEFSSEDLEQLQFLASHVSTLIENAKLYTNEKESNARMEAFMNHQQDLVKQTLVDQGFGGITDLLAKMMNSSVLLFDRFMHLSARHMLAKDEPIQEAILEAVERDKKSLMKFVQSEYWLTEPGSFQLGLWRVVAGGDSVGYLGLVIPNERLDLVLRMTVNHALSVYATQFVKQKLVLDVHEQVKDGFFNQLFVERIADEAKILEYAHLLNWDITQPHCIAIFSFEFDKTQAEHRSSNILEDEAKKNRIWELIRDQCARKEPSLFLTRSDGHYIAIVPKERVLRDNDFWKSFYERIERLIRTETDHVFLHIGISQETKKLKDYHFGYKQAQKTLTLLCNRFPQQGYMTFNQLGSYSVLYQVGDPVAVHLFIDTYLGSLLKHGNGKNQDLLDTLRVYLQTNGNIKETANLLFIHRSSMKYRLEKIRQIVELDIDDADQRFHLMLAFRLYDLFGASAGTRESGARNDG